MVLSVKENNEMLLWFIVCSIFVFCVGVLVGRYFIPDQVAIIAELPPPTTTHTYSIGGHEIPIPPPGYEVEVTFTDPITHKTEKKIIDAKSAGLTQTGGTGSLADFSTEVPQMALNGASITGGGVTGFSLKTLGKDIWAALAMFGAVVLVGGFIAMGFGLKKPGMYAAISGAAVIGLAVWAKIMDNNPIILGGATIVVLIMVGMFVYSLYRGKVHQTMFTTVVKGVEKAKKAIVHKVGEFIRVEATNEGIDPTKAESLIRRLGENLSSIITNAIKDSAEREGNGTDKKLKAEVGKVKAKNGVA